MSLNNREILRIMTFSAYDLQLIRMQMGLRLTANFRNKLKREFDEAKESGIDLGDEEEQNEDSGDELSEKALKLIDELKASHRRLTDAVAKSRRGLPARKGFSGDALISEFTELVLVDQYMQIERDEKNQFQQLEEALIPLPIYETFLKNQVGIGPAMAAVLVSYFDPYKAERISNFWSYAGLDVVDSEIFVTNCNKDEALLEIEVRSENSNINLIIGEPMEKDGKSSEELKADGMVGIYTIVGRGRSRRAEHLIDREYLKNDGTTGTRKSVTYNPWLKSRLLGALATSFLRTKNCPWKEQYDNYKHRINTDPNRLKVSSDQYKKAYRQIADGGEYHFGPTKEMISNITLLWPPLRVHRAAMRFMIKMFLIDFWVAWRKVEGLTVTPTYHEAILGHVHHRAAE